MTIDRNLRTVHGGVEIPMSEGLAVLEIKYDEFLPDIVKLAVSTSGRMSGSFSKYAAVRRLD
ncbi:MAG: VTC domain-containing protein [Emergencia sp.]